MLKALKKLFKPGKTPAPHHETHIEPAAAPVAPAAIVAPAPDLRIRTGPEHLRYIVEKGSITVDGVSLTVDEMQYILNDCNAKLFITSNYKRDAAAALVDLTPKVTNRFILDTDLEGYARFEDAVAAQPAEPLPSPRTEGLDMLYSSGTTGRPKGVKLPLPTTEFGEVNAVTGLAQFLFGFDEDAVYLSPAPLYHAAPLRFTMGVHRIGGTVIVMENFDPERALEYMIRNFDVDATPSTELDLAVLRGADQRSG